MSEPRFFASVYINELATELSTDPTGLGYTPTNSECLAIINNSRPEIQVEASFVKSSEVTSRIVPSEWSVIPDTDRQLFGFLLGLDVFEVTQESKQLFNAIFSAGVSKTAILELLTRDGSRAEELWGVDFKVAIEDIRMARKV